MLGDPGTSFTYQGQLDVGGEPVSKECTLLFSLYDGEAGAQIGDAITVTQTITEGLFTANLNTQGEFGPQPFAGDERWLGIQVKCVGDDGFTELGFQELTAVPYAHYAISAGALHGRPVTTTAPSVGQVLEWDGATWGPALDDDTTDGLLPAGAMVLGAYSDTALINAGFSPTLRSLEGWNSQTAMPTARYVLGAAEVDGIIYAIGGYASTVSAANEAYDPVTNSWVERAPMPTARYQLAVAEMDGVIYAIGGVSAITTCETTVEAYYPISDTWVTKAPMPTGRYALAAASANGLIYAIGGDSCEESYLTTVEAYNPSTDSWSDKMFLPTGRSYLAATEANGIIYGIGGSSASAQSETANEAYYPITNTWVSMTPMPMGRRGLAAATVDGVIHVVGGQTSDYSDRHETYDPTSDSWNTRIRMLSPRSYLAAAVVDSSLYAIGGTTPTNERDLNEVYHPPLFFYRKE